ncbi:uncharacterized protein V1516DRAFT_632682 [Lipomyces oligophaga]|uniref:uncharacterized protein n=1 Tax=Lipomyces oligophaga TaxID=45792 RepID=UPI0034CE862F
MSTEDYSMMTDLYPGWSMTQGSVDLKNQFLSPSLPPRASVSPELLYNSSPDLSLSGSESEMFYSAPLEDSTNAYNVMTKIWDDQSDQLMSTLRGPPTTDFINASPVIAQEPALVGNRYDIISKVPIQSTFTTPGMLLSQSQQAQVDGPESYGLPIEDFPDYGLTFKQKSSAPWILPSSPPARLPMNAPPQQAFAYSDSFLTNNYMHGVHDNRVPVESDYEADYTSDAVSPAFSPTEDMSDFSSPELTQSHRFASAGNGICSVSGNGSNKKTWTTTWRPILTSDPVTNQKLVIDVDESEADEKRNRLPTRTLDVYVIGPTKDNKYICNYNGCNKQFGRRYNIRTHIQTHLSDKPHSCPVCSARFVRQHDLRRHEKIHEDARPFVCPCGKSFARQDALSRHRLRKICVGGLDPTDHSSPEN